LDDLKSATVVFENIRIDDITNTLQIRIAKINGQDAETAAAQGKIQYSTNWQKWVAVARGQQAREAARQKEVARQTAKDKFLDNSGIVFSGWGGFTSGDDAGGGGGEIELLLSRHFSLQSGFQIFKDADDNPFTIIQIPVLAKFNSFPYPGAVVMNLSFFAGMGINLLFIGNDDIALQSPSKLSIIAGGEITFAIPFFYIGYQYNRDLSDTTYSFNGASFSYLGTRHIMKIGLKFFIPFRKSNAI
jgi:hypothetical protein